MNIIVDWLKNYQFLEQTEQNEELVLEYKKNLVSLIVEKKVSPYDNPVFCEFLYHEFIEKLFVHQDMITQTQSYGGKPMTQFNMDINTSISILNLICIMN